MSLIDQAKEQMAKTVENTKENFAGIRTGRANPALLNGIVVDYYGAPTPIKAVASIGVPEPRTLSVTPFDASQAAAVEKAIRNSDLGVSPNRDGNVIRLTMPELTEDRRKEYVKLAKSKAEDGKVARTRAIVCSRISTRSPSPLLMRLMLCWTPSRRRSWRSDSIRPGEWLWNATNNSMKRPKRLSIRSTRRLVAICLRQLPRVRHWSY